MLKIVEESIRGITEDRSRLTAKVSLKRRVPESELLGLLQEICDELLLKFSSEQTSVVQVSILVFLREDNALTDFPAAWGTFRIDEQGETTHLHLKVYQRYWLPTLPLLFLGEKLLVREGTLARRGPEEWSPLSFSLARGDEVVVKGSQRYTAGGDYQYFRIRVAHEGREGWIADDKLAFPRL